jgi:hypothetical protein
MRDLIFKVLREEAEMSEMGIKVSRLKSLQPKQYLVKTTKKEQKAAEEKKRLKTITEKVNTLFSQISDDLKNLSWEDIYLHPKGMFFYVILPSKIKTKMKRLADLYGELVENDANINLVSPREKIEQFYNDYFEFLEKDFIYVYVDKPRNRTHFPQGLPKSLLGYNIGIKIYKQMLNTLNFIQSEPNATKEVQAIYRKLIESPDVNCVIYKDLVLLIKKSITKDEKIKIVGESIYERYIIKPNSKKLVINQSIVLDSSLMREIGENRLQSMIDDIYYYSKDNFRVPFEDMDYDYF